MTEPVFNGWGSCEVCGKPIARPKEATISVCLKRVDAYEETYKEWEAHNVEHIGKGMDITRGYEGHPDRVEWMVTHAGCACPGCDAECGCDYWFACDRFDSLAKVLAWTLHLQEKTWLDSTDWERLVRRLYRLPSA